MDTSGTFGGLSSLAAAHFSNINSINVRNDTLYLSTDKNLFWWNGSQFFNLIVGLKKVERSFYYKDTTYVVYTDNLNNKAHVSKIHTGNVLPPILTSDLEDPIQNFQTKFYSVSVCDSGFFIGGDFNRINGKSAAALLYYGNQKINHFGKCGLPVYSAPYQYAEARTIYSDSSSGLYYVGGNFLFSDHLFTPNISAWNGSNWLNVGEGLSGPVNTIIEYNGSIYVGGKFQSSGDTILNNIARWDGSSWRPVGNGTNGEVKKLLVHNNELYIGGNFTLIDTVPVSYCAKYDGTQFISIGDSTPLLHPVYDMIFYKGRLHASLREHLLFKLTGQRWNSIGLVSSYAMGLAKTSDTLFIGTAGVIIYLVDSIVGTIITYNSTTNRLSPLFINDRLYGTCDYFLLCRNNSSFDHYVYQFAAKASANISPTQSIVGGYFPYTISTFGKDI
ncbi:MAG: hypothetical protein IPK10_18410 [Bacteroidetes bacterium]|nr:hypothetical protein [Bacteroidota bacterium]